MLDQRITIPHDRMCFGNNTKQMIDNALIMELPVEFLMAYEPVCVMARAVGTKGRLEVVWKIGEKHVDFSTRSYGKVTLTLTKEARRQLIKEEPGQQIELPLFEEEA